MFGMINKLHLPLVASVIRRQVMNSTRIMRFSAVVKMYYSEGQHQKQDGKPCVGPKFNPCVNLIRRAFFVFIIINILVDASRRNWEESNEKGGTCGTVHRILQANFNHS